MNPRSAPVRRRRSQNLPNGIDLEVSSKKQRTKRVSPPRRRPSTGRQDEDRKPVKKPCTPQTAIKTPAKAVVKPAVKTAAVKAVPKTARKPSPKPTRKKRDDDVLVVKKPGPRKKPAGKTSGAVMAGLCDVFSTKCDLKEEARTRTRLRNRQELWPAHRVQRVASLNAMAKVHILYENEGRPPHGEDMASHLFVEDTSCRTLVSRTSKARPVEKPKPRLGKRKREMVDSDVEIIDTRQCRRMASLNAQAIMAASYSQERSRIRKYEKESSCEMKVVHHHQEEIVVVQTKTVHRKVHEKSESPDSDGSSARGSRRDVSRQRPASSASSSQSVAVSEYREVVHINTTKEVKDEQEKEAAAVTHMYRYHTKATCLQMQTTYSGEPPGPPVAAILGPQGYYAGYPAAGPPAQGTQATPALLAAPAVTTATGAYTVDRGMVVSVAPIHRHYGSAFTVPRYGHALPYAAPVEYVPNYFQPAGPMIQAPGHEQCLIHKPVPFHPQQHLTPVGAPPPFPSGPPAGQPARCFAEHLAGPSSPSHGGAGSSSSSFPPFAPPFPPPYRQAPPTTTSPTPDAGTSYQIKMASTAAPSAAVPKSEPVTPPETKSPPQGNEFSDASKALGKDAGKEGTMTVPFQPESALMAPVVAKKGQRTSKSTSEKTQRRSVKTTLAETKTSEKGPSKTAKKNSVKQPEETEGSEKLHGKNGFKGHPLVESGRSFEKKRAKEAQTAARQDEPEDEASVASGAAATVVAEQEGEQATSKTKKSAGPLQSNKAASTVALAPPRLPLCRKQPRRKFAHGWSWDGEPFQKVVVVNNEDTPQERTCFPAMRHAEGDVIRVRDCVLLRSGTRKIDLPFVAKVAALWENDDDGEMMMSLLWYYRPEHTDQGRKSHHMEDEIFASKHRDCNSVACIEDKCYVLTFAEYCRYRARMKLLEEGRRPCVAVVPDLEQGYARRDRLPPGRMDPQLVFFCRRVYDFRQRRILKNPS